ncbi:hypothetical protein [Pseudooceanicola sp. 200-1SW]|uniref:hypothetical protein n=1 Tax=Pseudooceanicola sp. 200-1SW TaxID=3425949 RepID=UPI003D7F2B5C
MNRAQTSRFLSAVIAFLALEALLIGLAGGQVAAADPARALHLADLVLRLAAGQVPHLDVATPLGGWSVAPMALLLRAGATLGQAILWAPWGLAVLLVPALLWIGWSRLTLWPALALVLACLPLVLAPSLGGAGASVAPHQIRWAWALVCLLLPVLLFPPVQGRAGDWADAAVLGLPMAALAMIAPAAALALLPACGLGLPLSGRARLLARAGLLALAVLGLVTLVQGAGYWAALGRDLRSVVPAQGLGPVLLAPMQALALIAALVAVWLLWAIPGRAASGSTLLLCLPGFVYLAWRGGGADPLWLAGLGVVLIGLPGPEADPDRERILRSLGGIMLVLIAPVWLALAASPLRLGLPPEAGQVALLPGQAGILAPAEAAGPVVVQRPWTGQAQGPSFAGAPLEDCAVVTGVGTYVADLARDMGASAALDGQMPLVADRIAPQWIWLDWAPPVARGSEAARHLLVPGCALDPGARAQVLAGIDPGAVVLVEETPLYRLYRLAP